MTGSPPTERVTCPMCDEEISPEVLATGELCCSPVCKEVARREDIKHFAPRG